jgi:phosphate transport system permease protein
VLADPSVIGGTLTLSVPVADPYDQLQKGVISRSTPEANRRLSDEQIAWFDRLVSEGVISTPFNWGLLFNADSRFPEIAGLAGAIVGSFYALLVCFLISFPLGVGAAAYLEEFAPKNRWTTLIEVNINNLAAVPSIVFGLLGLAVFLQFFGLPRSAPLVGGMVLSLMTLPTIIIVTRNALKAVPPSIREAAFGMGASRHQVIMHHVLPLALPGILTGTIIGLAQALGETAPLLLIGMNAFITSPPGGLLDASTALPTQIFIWADSPERGFVARTSAGILVLLGFLLAMNGLAIYLRSRLERRA